MGTPTSDEPWGGRLAGTRRSMRLVGRPRLTEFGNGHPDAVGALRSWEAEIRDANWNNPHELKARYQKASLLGNGLVVFNVRGNRYRLLARFDYENQHCIVLRLGTHKEYDGWEL